MADNPYVNKVDTADGDTLIDLTSDTATAGDVIEGKTLHLASGAPATGTLSDATQSTHGLMSAADKQKLDGIEANANNYSLPTMSPATKGGAKLGDGLSIEDDALNLGPLTDSGSGASVQTDGCGIFGVTGEGFAHQDGAPTPSNPQEIRVARGRNLWDLANSITAYLQADGVVDPNGSGKVSPYILLEPGTYVMSRTYSGEWWKCNRYNLNKVYQETPVNNNNKKVNTFTISERSYVLLGVDSSSGNVLDGLQLEKGSTPTPYVPYGYMGLEVQGKNVWGLASSYAASGSPWVLTDTALRVPAGTYRISAQTPSSDGRAVFYFKDSNGTQLYESWVTFNGGKATDTITLSADAAFVAINLTDGATISNIQLEAGTTVTDYEPYHHTITPIPLPAKGFAAKLGDYADTLEVNSAGGYVWTNQTNIVALSGGEAWSSGTYYGFTAYYYGLGFSTRSIGAANRLCTNFPQADSLSSSMANESMVITGVGANNHGPFVRYDAMSSVQDFKTYLAGKPMKILYAPISDTTESGYIDLPELPKGATVSIPELEEIGVEWWVERTEEIAEHAENWYQKGQTALAQLQESVSQRTIVLPYVEVASDKTWEQVATAIANTAFGMSLNTGTCFMCEGVFMQHSGFICIGGMYAASIIHVIIFEDNNMRMIVVTTSGVSFSKYVPYQ